MSASKRPPILEQQSDETIDLRRLADIAEDAEWAEEEITSVTTPPARAAMQSSHEIHIHMPKSQTPKPDTAPEPEAKNDAQLPWFVRAVQVFLAGASTWPRVFALGLTFAFVAYLLTHGIKLPW